MSGARSGVRLRQAVLVARELEPLAAALREQLGLREPFRDPGVGMFGLHNVVFALDGCFLEVVSPTRSGTTAGRYLERHGDGGYMVMFDVRDLAGARARAASLGVRVVWEVDLPDISGTHLHPGDIGGAIVSIDRPEPEASWRWGGPDWTGHAGEGAPLRIVGATITVPEPDAVAARWGQLLGVQASGADGARALALDDGEVRFRGARSEAAAGLTEIALALAPELRAGREWLELGGVRMRLLDDA
jgi:hypothetical protein